MRRALLVLAAATLTACSSSGSGPVSQPTSAAPTATATPTSAPTHKPRLEIPVTIAFAGDVHADGAARAALAPGALAAITPTLSKADLTVVNLETAITTRGTAAHKKFTFRAPPVLLTRLLAAGVDVVTAANNHGRVYGPVGLQDTLAAEKATGMPIIGIGQNAAEAFAPFRKTIRGVRVAVLGATQVLDGELASSWTATDTKPGLASAQDPTRLLAAVRAARRTSDLVVVYLHWGTELVTCPTERQRALATALTKAGADIIVGSHAHRLLAGGLRGTAFVDYGLGNFIFSTASGPGATTGVLTVSATRRHNIGFYWSPAVIRGGIPHPVLDPDGQNRQQQAWDDLRRCADVQPVRI